MTENSQQKQGSLLQYLAPAVLAATLTPLAIMAIELYLHSRQAGFDFDRACFQAFQGFSALVSCVLILCGVLMLVTADFARRLAPNFPRFAKLIWSLLLVIPLGALIIRASYLLFNGGQMARFRMGGIGPILVASSGILGLMLLSKIGQKFYRKNQLNLLLGSGAIFGGIISYALDLKLMPGNYVYLHETANAVVLVASSMGIFFLIQNVIPRGAKATGIALLATVLLAISGFSHLGNFTSLPLKARGLMVTHLLTSSRWISHIPYDQQPAGDSDIAFDGLSISAQRHLALRTQAREKLTATLGNKPFERVIVITADAIRADRCGFMGYKKNPTTPFLDQLAERSFIFTRAHSPAPSSFYSISSTLSGLYPATLSRLGHDPKTLADSFSEDNKKSLGFIPDAIFTVRDSSWPESDRTLGFDEVSNSRESPDTIKKIIEALTSANPPSLVYAHVMDPHQPYQSHSKAAFGKSAQDRYESEIARVDRQLEKLFQALTKNGLLESTIFAFSADHGEEFGEHGQFAHGGNIFQTQCHVPLLIHAPRFKETKRLDFPVTTTSLAATIADLCNLDPAPVSEAPSLLPAMLGLDFGEDAFAVVERPTLSQKPGMFTLRGFIQGDWKLISDLRMNIQQVYNLKNDPSEKKDIAHSSEEQLAKFRHLESQWASDSRLLATSQTGPGTSEWPAEYAALRDQIIGGDYRDAMQLTAYLSHPEEKVWLDASVLLFETPFEDEDIAVLLAKKDEVEDRAVKSLMDALFASRRIFREETKKLPPEHLHYLQHPDARIRETIARACSFTKQTDALPLAKIQLKVEKIPNVIKQLESILAANGDEEGIQRLLGYADGENVTQIKNALTVLVELEEPSVFEQLTTIADRNRRMRNLLARALVGTKNERKRDWLADRWRDPNELIRRSAFYSMAKTLPLARRKDLLSKSLLREKKQSVRLVIASRMRFLVGDEISSSFGNAFGLWPDIGTEIAKASGTGERPAATGPGWFLASGMNLKFVDNKECICTWPQKGPIAIQTKNESWSIGGVVQVTNPKNDVKFSLVTAQGQNIHEFSATKKFCPFALQAKISPSDLPLTLKAEHRKPGSRVTLKAVIVSKTKDPLTVWPSDFEDPAEYYCNARFSQAWVSNPNHVKAIWLMRTRGTFTTRAAPSNSEIAIAEILSPVENQHLTIVQGKQEVADLRLKRGLNLVEIGLTAPPIAGEKIELEFRCRTMYKEKSDPAKAPQDCFIGLRKLTWQ